MKDLHPVHRMGTFLVTARQFGRLSALASAALVGLCAMFTEMNYLEPESLVFLSGLAAFYLLTRNDNITSAQLYGAGLWLGIGFAFKSVAAFYFIGVAFFLLVRRIPDGYLALGRRIIEVAFLSAGFGTALVIPMVYFGMTDRQALGTEVRYFRPGVTFVGLVDYDIHYGDLNDVLLLGTIALPARWTASVNLDHRRSPTLSTRNALIGQPVTRFDQLFGMYTPAEIEQLARDRTATSDVYTLSL